MIKLKEIQWEIIPGLDKEREGLDFSAQPLANPEIPGPYSQNPQQ